LRALGDRGESESRQKELVFEQDRLEASALLDELIDCALDAIFPPARIPVVVAAKEPAVAHLWGEAFEVRADVFVEMVSVDVDPVEALVREPLYCFRGRGTVDEDAAFVDRASERRRTPA
jgi:hypothetical protein